MFSILLIIVIPICIGSCTKYKEYCFEWGSENSCVCVCDAYPTTSAQTTEYHLAKYHGSIMPMTMTVYTRVELKTSITFTDLQIGLNSDDLNCFYILVVSCSCNKRAPSIPSNNEFMVASCSSIFILCYFRTIILAALCKSMHLDVTGRVLSSGTKCPPAKLT